MRGMAPPDAIEKALDKTLLVHLPKIPGVGLFLDRVRTLVLAHHFSTVRIYYVQQGSS